MNDAGESVAAWLHGLARTDRSPSLREQALERLGASASKLEPAGPKTQAAAAAPMSEQVPQAQAQVVPLPVQAQVPDLLVSNVPAASGHDFEIDIAALVAKVAAQALIDAEGGESAEALIAADAMETSDELPAIQTPKMIGAKDQVLYLLKPPVARARRCGLGLS